MNKITYDLQIKEVDQKIIITIDKDRLNAEYILRILNSLQLIFQKQQDQTSKIRDNSFKQRTWNYSGSVNMNKRLDNVNIRDFAYE
ncbi:MAG: hypothetical protein H7A23_12900 [Leptospiraceae bacterium]|nr:hypothetical protein [Leptospiraceae bacterium]MCP5495449.1 hypothetical protein [Leptospiraceae bacterium]